jgi:hypothetical protein
MRNPKRSFQWNPNIFLLRPKIDLIVYKFKSLNIKIYIIVMDPTTNKNPPTDNVLEQPKPKENSKTEKSKQDDYKWCPREDSGDNKYCGTEIWKLVSF